MKNFRELKVWEKGHRLALDIYAATQGFPKEELYGLTSQLRRSVASIPTNIAEGCGRGTDRELAQFAQVATGSASEVEYLLQLSEDLGYLDHQRSTRLAHQVREVRKMLTGLIQTLRADG